MLFLITNFLSSAIVLRNERKDEEHSLDTSTATDAYKSKATPVSTFPLDASINLQI